MPEKLWKRKGPAESAHPCAAICRADAPQSGVFLCFPHAPSVPQNSFDPFLVQPFADDDEHLLPCRNGGCGQAVGGGIQLHPAGGILHKALDPQHPAAGGIREQAGNARFQLLPGQAQLEEIRRTECIVRIKAELFAVSMLIATGIQRRKIRILQVGPVLDQKIFFRQGTAALAGRKGTLQVSMALSRWAWVAS